MKALWIMLMALAMVIPAALTGCGSDTKLDTQATIMDVDVAKNSRTMFDKYGGDYTKLTPEDKATYLEYYKGDEEKAKKIWDLMANPNARGTEKGT
ncbi:MAG: hypothetical protein ACKVQS_04425 [Fimbriimonadaceae bacterium]